MVLSSLRVPCYPKPLFLKVRGFRLITFLLIFLLLTSFNSIYSFKELIKRVKVLINVFPYLLKSFLLLFRL